MHKYFFEKWCGWLVFLTALISYVITVEPTNSFWDCGEYIATAYKLEVGHPPGGPFFQMLGRVTSMFTEADKAALMINSLSAICSSLSILFLFWTITALGRLLVLSSGKKWRNMGLPSCQVVLLELLLILFQIRFGFLQ